MSSCKSFTIRYAEPNDFEAVNAIHETAYPDDYYTYAKNIGVPEILNLVAEADDRAIGFITVLLKKWNPSGRTFWERSSPYIGFIGVDENYRRISVAEELIKTASIEALTITGEEFIYLECESDNRKALKLYEKSGFEVLPPDEIERLFNYRYSSQKSGVFRCHRKVFDL